MSCYGEPNACVPSKPRLVDLEVVQCIMKNVRLMSAIFGGFLLNHSYCVAVCKSKGGQRFVLSSFVSCYGEPNACVPSKPRLGGPEVGQRPFVKKQLLLLLSGVLNNYTAYSTKDICFEGKRQSTFS